MTTWLTALWLLVFALVSPSVFASFQPQNEPIETESSVVNLTLNNVIYSVDAGEITEIGYIEPSQNSPKSAYSDFLASTTSEQAKTENNLNINISLCAEFEKTHVGGLCQSADPILSSYMDGKPNGGVYGSVNLSLYSYVGNMPVNATDPDGRRTEYNNAGQANTINDGRAVCTNGWSWELKPPREVSISGGSVTDQVAKTIPLAVSIVVPELMLGRFGMFAAASSGVSKVDDAGRLMIGGAATESKASTFNTFISYSPRIAVREAEDPIGHGFPRLLDAGILATKPTSVKGGGLGYAVIGSRNGTDLIYNIIVKDNVIVHRDLIKLSNWSQRSKSFGWPIKLEDIPRLPE